MRTSLQRPHDANRRHRKIRQHASRRDQKIFRGPRHGGDRTAADQLQRVHAARLTGQRRVLHGRYLREAQQDAG